jgi:hypothetical protein
MACKLDRTRRGLISFDIRALAGTRGFDCSRRGDDGVFEAQMAVATGTYGRPLILAALLPMLSTEHAVRRDRKNERMQF